MIEMRYVCDLCRAQVTPGEPGSYRLKFAYPHWKVAAITDGDASETIICKACVASVKAIPDDPATPTATGEGRGG